MSTEIDNPEVIERIRARMAAAVSKVDGIYTDYVAEMHMQGYACALLDARLISVGVFQQLVREMKAALVAAKAKPSNGSKGARPLNSGGATSPALPAGADTMAEPEITPGMTADDWYDEGYRDHERRLPYEAGPHDKGAEVMQHWDRGWYAAEADRLALEGE